MRTDDMFETITAELVTAIEAGTREWRMPWHALADAGTPVNVDGRPYRGMNAVWLPCAAAPRGWDTGIWGTYRSWQRHGGQVRRGEHATPVVLWKQTAKPDLTHTTDGAQLAGRGTVFARAYSVFAAEQVDGADEIIACHRQRRIPPNSPERLAIAERFFAALDAHVIEGGNQACYIPATDTIRLPTLAQFDTAAHYYATRAHETVHWTGHATRLARDLTARFGTDAYAAEELVAELGAAMWCAQTGLSAATRHDHAAYLAAWLRVLRSDARALVTVASRAQAAIDWLNARADVPADAAAG